MFKINWRLWAQSSNSGQTNQSVKYWVNDHSSVPSSQCVFRHTISPLTALVCKPSRDEPSLVTWVSASPDFPVPQLQNLTFSQWIGIQQLLFLLKTHLSAARQPAHLPPCHNTSDFSFSAFPKAFRVDYSSLPLLYHSMLPRQGNVATDLLSGSNGTCLKRSLEQNWTTCIWGNCKQVTAYAPYFRCKL